MSWFPYTDYEYSYYSNKELESFYDTKKLFVFDLDDTLMLSFKTKEEVYSKKIVEFLKKLKNKGKIITMATHNSNPHELSFYNNDLYSLFLKEDIMGPIEARDHQEYKLLLKKYDHHIREKFFPRKSEIIINLAKKYDIDLNDVIFFDNDKGYIKQGLDIGVTSILVDEKSGIYIPE